MQFLICKRKLESKKEALLILSKELDTCQQERDQYKLMANQLRERHQGLKKKYRELIVSHLHVSRRHILSIVMDRRKNAELRLFLSVVHCCILEMLHLMTDILCFLTDRMEIPLCPLRKGTK